MFNVSKLTRIAKIAAVAAVASAAAPAAASAAGPVCAPQVTAPVFAQFGDLRDYYLAPGGSFETGITWAKSGAVSLAATNETFFLGGLGHTNSAKLLSGGKITSPKLCVSKNEPYLRFVAKAASGSGQMDVTVRVYDANGNVTDTSSGSVSPSAHSKWAPSGLIALKTDSWAAGETGYVDVSFRSQGDWNVDDVFVDPYRR